MKRLNLKICALALAAFVPAEQARAGIDPFLGDVMIVGFNFCPIGWAQANGQLLAISSNQSLFSLLGTMYGGDGRTTFALPDLRGRYAINNGTAGGVTTTQQGQRGGQETVTLTEANMAPHTHVLSGNPTGHVKATTTGPNTNDPAGGTLATFPAAGNSIYNETQTTPAVMGQGSIKLTTQNVNVTRTGASQATFNIQPVLAMQVCIATQGVFPSRN
jgi:microcystin-dependent protein